MGNPIKAKPVPMEELNLKMGTATVEGKVFCLRVPGDPAARHVAAEL